MFYSFLGGDWMVSCGEFKKLCFYVMGKEWIESEDVEVIIGDVFVFEILELIDVVVFGDLVMFDYGLECFINVGFKVLVIVN